MGLLKAESTLEKRFEGAGREWTPSRARLSVNAMVEKCIVN